MAPQRFALHLDGKVLCSRILADQAELERVVRHVAGLANMRILHQLTSNIAEDLTKLGLDHFEDEGGISVQALISTSHVALHTWPKRSTFMFDLVSCKKFDSALIREYLTGTLGVYEVSFISAVDTSCRLSSGR